MTKQITCPWCSRVWFSRDSYDRHIRLIHATKVDTAKTELDEATERFNDITTDLFTTGMAAIEAASKALRELNETLEALQ